MKKIIRIQQPEDAQLNLTWVINNICTNSCSYCPSELHAGRNHNYDWENARKFFKLLFEKYPRIHCSVAGGEPSISPFLPEIAKTFYEAGHTLGITSNAAKPIRYWEDIAKHLTYVCFSYHPESPDPQFLEKVRATAKLTQTAVRVMMLPDKWDECVEIYNQCYEYSDMNTEAVRIFDWTGINRTAHIYTEEQLAWFDSKPNRKIIDYSHLPVIRYPNITANAILDTGEILRKPNPVHLINNGMTNFNGYTCEIGLKSFFVFWDGSIRRGNCSVGGNIGNINDPDNIQWPTEPVKCNIDLCHCSSDVNINKWI